MDVKIVIDGNGRIPYQHTKGSGGFDLFVPKDTYVEGYNDKTFGRQIIPMDIHLELPKGIGAFIQPRSGYSAKGFEGYDGYRVEHVDGKEVNKFFVFEWKDGELVEVYDKPKRYDVSVELGLCDEDYRGIYGVIIKNFGGGFWLKEGTRIAQVVFKKIEDEVDFEIVGSLSESERGENGYGSSNK